MTSHSSNRRIALLTASEYHDFYSTPTFDESDQLRFFAFNEKDLAFLQSLLSIEDKIYVALLLGYFRAKHCLVSFRHYQVKADRQFIMDTYFNSETKPKKLPILNRQFHLQNSLLQHEQYSRFDKKTQRTLSNYLKRAVRQHPKAIPLFHALLDHVAQCCIALPGYSSLQKLMTQALSAERKRLSKLYHKNFSLHDKKTLKELLNNKETLSQLHHFKKDPKGFNYTEMRHEIKKHELLKPIYQMAQNYLPTLELPQETINYYGSLVLFYNVYKLNRMNPAQAHLYCLCYSHSRYQYVNDNLLNFFKYYVNRYDTEAREASQSRLTEFKREMQEILDQTGDVLQLILTPPYNNSVSKRKSFCKLSREKMRSAQLYLKGQLQDNSLHYWEHIDILSVQIKRNLTPLFQAIDFATRGSKRLDPIITFFRAQIMRGNHTIPLTPMLEKWLSPSIMNYMTMPKKTELNHIRLLFYFYKSLAHQIKTGQVYLQHSIAHKQLDDELIPRVKWGSESAEILKNIGYPKLTIPIDTLHQEVVNFSVEFFPSSSITFLTQSF